ncbi:MAG: bifunctional adenosylcobinamide kinase/adenosylcobinamide-phosphate guanylyltransferase [Rubrobacteraceae bacterium]
MLGGAKSGKSARAESLIKTLGGESVLYVATAEASGDEELWRRVREHRDRRPEAWATLELGGGDLTRVLDVAAGYNAVLIDSLTLWVSARMNQDDEGVLEHLGRFLEGASSLDVPFVLVSDEVGLGIVPESAAGRRFRDLLGEANQRVAATASEVHLCVAGNTLRIK